MSQHRSVVVFGSQLPLGRLVSEMARSGGDFDEVIAISSEDPGALSAIGPETCLVWLAPAPVATAVPDGVGGTDRVELADPFEIAEAAGVVRLVVLSSALVYGALPGNAVPLTEESPLRPDLSVAYVAEKAETERRAVQWRAKSSTRRVAVLRPAITVSTESAEWFRRSPWSAQGLEDPGDEAAAQFLASEDLARAVLVCAANELDGAHNVAPDGWIDFEGLRALGGPALPLSRLAKTLRKVLGSSSDHDELALDVFRYPLVIANDRLRAAGWKPTITNEEAYVAADPGGPLAAMSARRRQQAALVGASVLVAAPLVALAAHWLRNKIRARRSRPRG